MSVQVKRRRDTAANLAAFTGAQAELLVDTTNNRVQVHDGVTAGGWPAAKLSEVVTNTRASVSDAAYAALATDRTIAYTAITAARIVTLPASSAYPTGTTLTVYDESGNCSAALTITLSAAASDKIDGASSAVISCAYGFLALQSNGAGKWTIVDQATSNLGPVGVGTAADPNNPLSVYGSSALFNGTNFNFAINKSAVGDTASVLFQDAFSGRAQIGLCGNDSLSFKVSANGSTWNTGIAIDAATGAPSFANQRTPVSDANYAVLATDREIAYAALTAARTVTLPSAASFPAGVPLLIVDESGACSATNSITVARTGSDTIDGKISLAMASPYGAARLVSNGSNAWIVAGRSVNIVTFSSSGTYTPSPGMTFCDVVLFGGGGGGGGGCLEAASTACSGGGGGGGAAQASGRFTAAQVGASQTITVGSGGAAGAAATSSTTAGGAGGAGGYTGFGALLKAWGGGFGAGGQLSATGSGGGGGAGFGQPGGGSGATGGGGGLFGSSGGSAASAGNATATGGSGGGGCSTAGVAGNGGNYGVNGATGGGSGGGLSSSNGTNNGGNGGQQVFNGIPINGGAGGTAGGSVNGVQGASNTAGPLQLPGVGGGGGASATSGTAGAGAQGGSPGGGGGGGGSAQNGGTAGAGGVGGAGICVIVEWF
ncbi:MAG: hypothetical protein ABSC22_03850 [Roseiarcus sp.]